jgi:MFS family permease
MHGLYLLWWVQEKQMSPAVVAAALAAGDIALAILEVPTGWIADRFGHRVSLIAGSTVQVLGMLCCWWGRGLPGLVAASVLVALGDAFRSGADQALVYRSCVALGREQDFQAIEARTRALQQAALVALVLIGGWLVDAWGFAAGWALESALCAAGIAMACAMVEPRAAVIDSDITPPAPWTGNRRRMLAIVLPATLLGAAAGAASFVAQTGGGWDALHVTRFVAVVSLAEAAGAATAMRMRAGLAVQMWMLAIGTAIVAASFAVPSWLNVAVVALSFLGAVAHPVRAAAIQRAVADHVRARAASFASACDTVLAVITLPIAGALRRKR